MKRFLLATVSVVALTSVARAADMPAAMPTKERMYAPAPIVDWTGGYFGIQGGGVLHDTKFNEDGFFTASTLPTRIEDRKTGGTAGAVLGYNWQQGRFVYGVEGAWNWVEVRSRQFPLSLSGFPVLTSYNVNGLATLRGRIGLAFDRTLVYATGGAAIGNIDNSVDLIGTGGASGRISSFTQKQTKAGWVVGGGVEQMLSPHWTFSAKFHYIDLGRTTVSCSSATDFENCVSIGYRGEFSNRLIMGLVGLAYKF
ncbi:MAG: outer membrane beta-barrel protein [Pseudolabrys sp.]